MISPLTPAPSATLPPPQRKARLDAGLDDRPLGVPPQAAESTSEGGVVIPPAVQARARPRPPARPQPMARPPRRRRQPRGLGAAGPGEGLHPPDAASEGPAAAFALTPFALSHPRPPGLPPHGQRAHPRHHQRGAREAAAGVREGDPALDAPAADPGARRAAPPPSLARRQPPAASADISAGRWARREGARPMAPTRPTQMPGELDVLMRRKPEISRTNKGKKGAGKK